LGKFDEIKSTTYRIVATNSQKDYDPLSQESRGLKGWEGGQKQKKLRVSFQGPTRRHKWKKSGGFWVLGVWGGVLVGGCGGLCGGWGHWHRFARLSGDILAGQGKREKGGGDQQESDQKKNRKEKERGDVRPRKGQPEKDVKGGFWGEGD